MPPHRLCLVALNPTDSVTEGFLPAATALGLRVTLLTDQPDAHAHLPYDEIVDCDVRDFRAIVYHVDRTGPYAAVFSNSDHLQTQTALAARYAGLPAKDWRAALRTKNKARMRAHLTRTGGDHVWSRELAPGAEVDAVPFPCVVKPREGVASEDVVLVANQAELAAATRDIWRRTPGRPLVVEEFLTGPLHTLETIGDGGGPRVVGGFHTTLSPPPYFIEQSMVWHAEPPLADGVLKQFAALGAGFGACHTEYIVDGERARLVEVNYRVIGDQCDLLLADLTGLPLFEYILRVHLGESLPPLRPAVGSARLDWRCADRGGTLVAAPPTLDIDREGVRLRYRPLREIGEDRPLTNTNRDYLGVVRTIGHDQAAVDRAAGEFLATRRWDIEQ
jgi:hypothetical protein